MDGKMTGRSKRDSTSGVLMGRARLRTLAVALGGAAVWLAAGLGAGRLRAVEETADIVAGERSEGEALASALGGFRGLVADFLWLRAIQVQDEGRFDETTLLCKLILDMQPRFAGVWNFMSWNLAYNVAFESNTPPERWHWIREGLRLLEEEGIDRNRNSWEIPFDIGFLYYSRVSRRGHDPMYRHYQEKLAPVPAWCADAFEFVDRGLWSDRRVRYRLYRRSFPAGKVTLGAASASGGFPTRSARMYVILVKPSQALARAARVEGGGAAELRAVGLAPGAPLYTDAPDRVAAGRHRMMYVRDRPEPAVPSALGGAALVPVPDGDRALETDIYVELSLAHPAEVWVGWVPDETRNYELAQEWLARAEHKPGSPVIRISKLRAHALFQAGRWEEAYEVLVDLMTRRVPGDRNVSDAFRNALALVVYKCFAAADREGVERWHGRLRASLPSWTMSPAETAQWAASRLGLPWPPERRREQHR